LREGSLTADLTALVEKYEDINLGSYPWFRSITDHGVALVARGTDEARLESVAGDLETLIKNQGVVPERLEGEASGNNGSPRPGVD
ncbi:MAG: hypothetical protein AAFR74_02465, partial [Pseudomonadota bacterium]